MISIIIPTLNEEKYIARLLGSLKQQTYKDYEVIVVDGNSDDNTKKIVKSFRFPRLINSRIRNVSYQRNLGAGKAVSNRLLFLDADGFLKKDFLEKAIDEIAKKDLTVTGCYLYPDSKSTFYKLVYFVFRKWVWFQNMTPTPAINGSCLFTTKKMHRKLNGFDIKMQFVEDYDYARRASKFCRIKLLRNAKLYTSVRRFEREGKLKLALKYINAAFQMDIGGKKSQKLIMT
ncbi:glycosyltransferase [Candidatus Woesearchaeota archaeon]|nr:glycosyltransferase [Candidatus Woesearchaeota archaeon]